MGELILLRDSRFISDDVCNIGETKGSNKGEKNIITFDIKCVLILVKRKPKEDEKRLCGVVI